MVTKHFGYDFSIVHRSTKTIKDIDALSRIISPLIHKYLATVSIMHYGDLKLRPFAYNYDVFHSYSTPRYMKSPTTTVIQISSSIPVPSTLHHISSIYIALIHATVYRLEIIYPL